MYGSLMKSIAYGARTITLSCVVAVHSTYAHASANISPPPTTALVTPGGVDIRTGRYIKYLQRDLSIGDESGGILFNRIAPLPVRGHADPMGNFWHNWNIVLTEKRVDIPNGKYTHGTGSDFRVSVDFDNRSDVFDSRITSSYSWKRAGTGPSTGLLTSGDRASNEAIYTYTTEDGTRLIFRPIGSKDCSTVLRCAYASKVIRPDGTIYTLEYEATGVANGTRLRSVTNNRGYALLLEYSGTGTYWNRVTKACVLNLTSVPQPTNNLCPTDAISVSYVYDAYGSMTVLTGATDAVGATSSFSYATAAAGATDGVPKDTKSSQTTYSVAHKKPGAYAPWLTLHMKVRLDADGAPDHIVGRQDFFDGSSYRYGYGTMQQVPGRPAEIVGGSYVNALGHRTTASYEQIPIPVDEWRAIVGTPPVGQAPYEYDQDDPKWMVTTPGPVSITDPLNRVITFDYCDRNWGRPGCAVTALQSSTDPEGIVTEYWYSFGHLRQSRQIAKAGTSLPDITGSSTLTCSPRSACGKPLTYTDPNANVSDYTYDAVHGGILTSTSPAATTGGVRPQKRYTYQQHYAWYKNSAGTLVRAEAPVWLVSTISECRTLASCAGTADETLTTYSYGTAGAPNNLLPTTVTISTGDNSLAATTSYSFDAQGNIISINGPLTGSADTTRIRYDALRRVIGTISPDPDSGGTLRHRAVRNTYNLAGDLVKIEKGTVLDQTDSQWALFTALQTMSTSYDSMGRKIRTTLSSGNELYSATDYSYDLGQRLECTATRMNPQWNTQADACTAQDAGANGPDRITRNVYNAAGELTKVQVAIGTADEADEATNTYNLNGRLQTLTDAEGNLTTYGYDGHNRLATINFPEKAFNYKGVSSVTDFEQFAYDLNGNVTERRLRDGKLIKYGFDNLNRQILKDLPDSETDVSSSYDLRGNVLDVVQGGSTVSLTWDGLGRNLTETSQYGSMSYQYDSAGRRTRTTWPDTFYTTQDYFVTGEVAAIREYSSGLVLATFGYDNLGLKLSIGRGNGTRTDFTYDNGSRLRSLSHDMAGSLQDVASTFAYNPANQITTWTRNNNAYAGTAHTNLNQSYGINGLNQITTVGSLSMGYDERGNLTSKGTQGYSYTVENRLSRAPNGASFTYDPTGRLLHASGTATFFQYDGTDLVAEYNSAKQLLRRYVHGPGADEPLVWYEGTGTSDRRWLHQDERGSTIAITNSTGATTAINSYDEFGVPGPLNAGRFQYTGQTWLADMGMYYYKARIYDPKLGRFLQTDPIGYEDQLNMYAYVGNDPVNKTDPTGMYGKGTGWEGKDKEWKKFDKAQQAGAKSMDKTASRLNAQANRLDTKGKPGGDALREKASYLSAGAAALKSNGSDGKIANGYSKEEYAKLPKSTANGAASAPVGGNVMNVNLGAKIWTTNQNVQTQQQWIVGHESLHTAGLYHQYFNTEIGYKFGSPDQQKAFDALRGTTNPDNLMQLVYPNF